MKKIFYTSIIVIFIISTSQAQKMNSISYNFGAMFFTQSHQTININQWGIQYERKFQKKFNISFAFNKWTTWNDKFMPRQIGTVYNKCWYSFNPKLCEKKIESRSFYKMLDVTFLKAMTNKKKFGILRTGAGISYTWGINNFVDSVITSNIPPFDNIETIYSKQHKKYIGVIPTLDYRYNFWGNRIALGTIIRARKYIGLKDIQLDFNLYLGYNF